MRVDLLSREYPPEVYGGAGVHVAELVRALREQDTDVRVRAFGKPRDERGRDLVPGSVRTGGCEPSPGDSRRRPADGARRRGRRSRALAHLVRRTAPASSHRCCTGSRTSSPRTASSRCDRGRPSNSVGATGSQAGSRRPRSRAPRRSSPSAMGMRRDILRSYPQLDPAEGRGRLQRHRPGRVEAQSTTRSSPRALGIDPTRPSVVFVGRITRQKGLPYLLRAAALLPPEVQLVLCAGAPDTPEILEEVRAGVRGAPAERTGVVWIDRLLASIPN